MKYQPRLKVWKLKVDEQRSKREFEYNKMLRLNLKPIVKKKMNTDEKQFEFMWDKV